MRSQPRLNRQRVTTAVRGLASVERALRSAEADATVIPAEATKGVDLLLGSGEALVFVGLGRSKGIGVARLRKGKKGAWVGPGERSVEQVRKRAEKAIAQLSEHEVARLKEVFLGDGKKRTAVPSGKLTAKEREILEEGGLDLSPSAKGQDDAIARSQREYTELMKRALTTTAAAKRIHVTEGRIRQRLLAKPPTLYGIRLRKSWKLPQFQFGERELIPGMEEVVGHIPAEMSVLAVDRWIRTPNADLSLDDGATDLSPLQWLQTGNPPKNVIELLKDL